MIILNKYWLNRLFKKLRNKGILAFLKSILGFLNNILNPSKVGEFPFVYLFKKKRRLIKDFCEKNLIQLDDGNIVTIGNYLVHVKNLNPGSIVYSFGIGENISFEETLSKNIGCKIYCYDPTSLAKKFMDTKMYDKEKITYQPYGIWIKDEKVKFYDQDINNSNVKGGSITNLFKSSNYQELQCYKFSTLMKQNNHNIVDLLKLDIEGAALEVLDHIINENIYLPSQIAVEFEYSEDDKIDVNNFSLWKDRVNKIIIELKNRKYIPYYIPRYSNLPYSTVEVLFVKKT